MHEELYADAIGEITVSGAIVRIDLVSLSPTERNAANQPKTVFRQRIILPVEGFANGLELMQEALQGLIDAGAIQRQPEAGTGSAPGKAGRPNGSPNFS